MLYYTWTPYGVSGALVPGKDVEWLKVPYTSLPNGATGRTEHEGKYLGFAVDAIGVIARNDFLAANPAAAKLFELAKISINDVSAENRLIADGEDSPEAIDKHVADWITANQATYDGWLADTREDFNAIPVIDVAAFLDGSDKQAAARQIRWALSNAGFMHVKNHGIAQDFVDQVFGVTRRFFDLPMSDMMALHVSRSNVALRGYIEPFGENTDPGKPRDLKECFGIALSLDLPETFFEAIMTDPLSIQRLLHYPPQNGQADRDIIGIGAHT